MSKEKAIYFEYPTDYDEIFEQLSKKLFDIDITDNKTYWIRPFQDRHFIKNKESKKTKLKMCLSCSIFDYLITDEKEKKEIDKVIEEFIVDIFNED